MLTVADISKMLTSKVEAVCQHLIPGGTIHNRVYTCANLDGGKGKSLVVNLEGDHAGKWKDWAGADDHRGDLVDLWRVKRGLSPGDTIQQIKQWLGIVEPQPVKKKTYAKAPPVKLTPVTPEGRAMKWFLEQRKITKATIDAYQVEVDTAKRAIVFPSYSPGGELINRSYRTIPKDGEKKDVWQETGCAPSLFGWQCLPESCLESKEVMICEGQIDCMTWYQWGMPCLSIPNGAGTTWIEYEWDNLSIFNQIWLSFDMDSKGRDFCRKAVERLGHHRCLIVSLPRKDANQCLQDGFTEKDARKWIAAAKPPELSGLISGNELVGRLAADRADKEKPFTLKIFDTDWEMRKGLHFRPREVTIWTGNSGHGKSTLLNWIQLCATCKGMNVFIGSFEVRAEKTMERIAHACLASESQPRTDDNILTWIELLGHRFILSDLVGYINLDTLFEQMKFAFHRYGVMHFFIDSLMRIEGLEEDYPAQGKFLNRLQEFAKTTGAHVHLVAHPSKNKDGGRVRMMDIKGSTLLMNNADNIVVVTKNPEKEVLEKAADQGEELPEFYHKMHDTEVTIEKQRETGWIGTFYLKFNRFDLTFGLSNKYSPPKPDKKPFRKKQWNNDSY